MRLICPNCDAQYEVSDGIVPRGGRDVQCSNCGKTWFQHHPDHTPAVEDVADLPQGLSYADEPSATDDPPVPAPPEPQRREIDAAVADILRQEAELEATARARANEGLESQPELGLESRESDSERRAREAQDRTARMRGEVPSAAAAAAIGSRGDLLPDIDEINSTLRSTSDRRSAKSAEDLSGTSAARPKRRRSGFSRGFFLTVLLVLILVVIYIFAPQIAQAMPQADPYLSAYVAKVDTLRSWLDGHVTSMLEWLDATASAQEK